MVDSISIRVEHARAPMPLCNEYERTKIKTGCVTRLGNHKNMYVRYTAGRRLSVKGSLPRYFWGSNVETMNRAHIKEAVEQFADEFGFHPGSARVFQLDLAATLSMPRPVAAYLPILGPASHSKQHIYPGESVIYEAIQRSLCFYDKCLEAGLETKEAGNLLRIELKLMKRLKERLGRPVVLSDLYEEDFYSSLVDHWRRCYSLVSKIERPTLSLEPTRSPRELVRQLAQIALHLLGGEAHVTALISRWECCDCDRKALYKLRRCTRGLAGSGTNMDDAALIKELDEAVDRAAKQALAV